MLQDSPVAAAEANDPSTAHFIHVAMRFLLAVRYRKNVVFASVAAVALMGALYYATATRWYSAKASLLVMYTAMDTTSPSMAASGAIQQNCTPTFENLITTTKVIEGALEHIKPEDCADLAGAPKERWATIIQSGLSAKAVRGTNIINVTYRSRDPAATVSVLNAVVQSYVEFLDTTNKGTAGEIIRVLTKEKVDLADKLARKGSELLEVRRQFGDLGIRSESKAVHPLVQRAISFNESLVAAQKRRIELEASLAAIQSAVRNGEDLQQHIMTLADAVGKELLFRSLGMDTNDAYTTGAVERGLLEDRTALRGMQEHLGPAHPEVASKIEKIRLTEQYLLEYQQRINRRVAEIQSTQLGPMLVQMVQQKLGESRQIENSLRREFEEAQDQAVSLNGQLARVEIIERDMSWLRNLHDVLLTRIANINVKHDGQDIRTALVEEPTMPSAPVYPKRTIVILLVLAGGIGIGLASVALLDILDDRFRSLDELQSQLGAAVLTVVRQLHAPESSGTGSLQIHASPDSPESEAFRTLRTALALADRDTRRLIISSPEPGDGKTTVLANLAVCFAQAGKKTLLIDADLRRPGLTNLLGMRGVEGVARVLRGEQEVAEMAAACIRPSGIEGLDVLPSGARTANPAELLAGPRFSELLAWAETVYEQILVDSPPVLIASDVAIVGRLVDGVVLLIQPDKNRRRQVIRAVETLSILKVPLLGLVVNRVSSDQDRGYYGYSSGYGYGYGYGYEYNDHKERQEERQGERQGAEESLEEEDPSADELFEGQQSQPQKHQLEGIVPRRAA
jgi:polysaccharide biosynthesis transport protein